MIVPKYQQSPTTGDVSVKTEYGYRITVPFRMIDRAVRSGDELAIVNFIRDREDELRRPGTIGRVYRASKRLRS